MQSWIKHGRAFAQATLLGQVLHSLTANLKDIGLVILGGFMKSCLIYEILSSWEAKLGEGAGQGKEGQHGGVRTHQQVCTACTSPAWAAALPEMTCLLPRCSKSKGNTMTQDQHKLQNRGLLPISSQRRGSQLFAFDCDNIPRAFHHPALPFPAF